MPIEGGGALPAETMAILFVRETGIEAEVTSINCPETLHGIIWHIAQWVESEPARLPTRAAEQEARPQRLPAGEEPIE